MTVPVRQTGLKQQERQMKSHGRTDEQFKARRKKSRANSKSIQNRLKKRADDREAKRLAAEAEAKQVLEAAELAAMEEVTP
jgi:hypothetical protein